MVPPGMQFKQPDINLFPLLVNILIALSLVACGYSGQGLTGQESLQSTFFIPPSLAPQANPTSTTLSPTTPAPSPDLTGQPRPTPTPLCQADLEFIRDLTIPDGSQVTPGTELDKRWLVENSGTCNWDENYRLRLIAGPDLGAQPEQALYPARLHTQVVIRLLFKVPNEPGSYHSVWQAFDPLGEPFGEPIFIDIVVETP